MIPNPDKPGTFTTEALEEHIEWLLRVIGPHPSHVSASFGVNVERWGTLEKCVLEYIRVHRNVRGKCESYPAAMPVEFIPVETVPSETIPVMSPEAVVKAVRALAGRS